MFWSVKPKQSWTCGFETRRFRLNVSALMLVTFPQLSPRAKVFSGEHLDTGKGARWAASFINNTLHVSSHFYVWMKWRWITNLAACFLTSMRANMCLFTVPRHLMTQMSYQCLQNSLKKNKASWIRGRSLVDSQGVHPAEMNSFHLARVFFFSSCEENQPQISAMHDGDSHLLAATGGLNPVRVYSFTHSNTGQNANVSRLHLGLICFLLDRFSYHRQSLLRSPWCSQG